MAWAALGGGVDSIEALNGIAHAATEAMSVSVKTIRRWIAAGTLPAYRCGKRAIRIKLDDLEAAPRQIPSARCWGRAGGFDRDARRLVQLMAGIRGEFVARDMERGPRKDL